MIYQMLQTSKYLRCISFSFAGLPERQQLNYGVVVVGGGVAGLATAIRLKQREIQTGRSLSVCLVQKGEEIGDHILSGNCFQTRGFDELFPNWRQELENRPPIDTQVTSDNFYIFTSDQSSIKIPQYFFPKTLDNHRNFVISLSKLTRWMGEKATELGVDIFPATPASEILFDEKGHVKGIATQDHGISRNGETREDFVRGIQLLGKQTVFAQGCRGSLSEKLIERFKLRSESDPQLYGIGLKQVWEVDNELFSPGYVQHTVGWPINSQTYAGTFMYHMKPNLIHLGMVVGLNYQNPYISPYEEFQRFKTHPQIKKFLKNGQCLSYGARALNSGGYFSIPKLTFPGGVLVGCSAGFMNVLKIKGSHTAIKSGIEAANAIFDKICYPMAENQSNEVSQYQKNMQKSWVWEQLHAARNIKNSFKNMYTGLLYGGIYKFLKGKEPFDIRNKTKDSQKLRPASNFKPITYPKHDRVITFDLLENLNRSGTNHNHDQPSHLVVKTHKEEVPAKSLIDYNGPEEKFCPARVYEFVDSQKGKKLQINAQNCLHCKTCSIKMVEQYIEWRTPQGSGGPKYNLM